MQPLLSRAGFLRAFAAAPARMIAIALPLLLFASGCVTISPWEREVLARPDMTFEGNPHVATAEEHTADTREGSTGGLGGGGGGCGCN